MATKYRKKPVVVEAELFDGTEGSGQAIIEWMRGTGAAARYFGEDTEIRVRGELARIAAPARIRIRTLEGDMLAIPGDFVIKGTEGEFYPCKPAAFAATFELVDRVIESHTYGKDPVSEIIKES